MSDKYHKLIEITHVYLDEGALKKIREFFDDRFLQQNRQLRVVIKLASGLERICNDFDTFFTGLKELSSKGEKVDHIDIDCSADIDDVFRALIFLDIYYELMHIQIHIMSDNFAGRSKDWVTGTLSEIDKLRTYIKVPEKKRRSFHDEGMAILDLAGKHLDDAATTSDQNRQIVTRKILWYKSPRWWVEKVILAILLTIIGILLNKYLSGKIV